MFRRMIERRMLTVVLMALVAVGSGGPRAQAADGVVAFLEALAPPPAPKALARIPDPARKLLALRSYVRMGANLADRWSWTKAEIEAFQGSDAQKALLAEVEAIKAHFAEANPGYAIYANTRVRSLDVQIARWNENASVGEAAEEIFKAWVEAFGGDPNDADRLDTDAVRLWLRRFRVTTRPNIAAPGLTMHGRASAIDFQIMKDGRIFAGADTSKIETVWRAEKWDEKLKASIDAAGPSFSGPLTRPDEPWHFTYKP